MATTAGRWFLWPLLTVAAVCLALGIAIRFRYGTELVRLQSGHLEVEVTDRWTGRHLLCELYGTYPTDCQTEISFEAAPQKVAVETDKRLTPEQCRAIEAQHKGTPLACVLGEPDAGQH